jgi:hypothetical protein
MDDEAKQLLREIRDATIFLRDSASRDETKRTRKSALEKRIAVIGLSFVVIMMAFMLYFLTLARPLFLKRVEELQRPSAADPH